MGDAQQVSLHRIYKFTNNPLINNIMSEFKHPDFENIVKGIVRNIKITAKVEGENFFKQSFNRQGFLDGNLTQWPKRKGEDDGRAVLVKSGKLSRSIKGFNKGNSIVFGTDGNVPYAEIHNNGGVITVTQKMKKYFWAQYIKATGGQKENKSATIISQKAAFFKRMAMMKVGSQIKIPKRQFIGESKTLMKDLNKCFIDIVNNEIKKL